jgi:hypothetical protein
MPRGDIAAQREVLAALIERGVPVRVGRGVCRVDATWTPLGEALQAAVDPMRLDDACHAA